jgi:hypothetical protein
MWAQYHKRFDFSEVPSNQSQDDSALGFDAGLCARLGHNMLLNQTKKILVWIKTALEAHSNVTEKEQVSSKGR